MSREQEIDVRHFKNRTSPARIIFEPGEAKADTVDLEYVGLENGGVTHVDHDGRIRWHPPHRIKMVIFRNTQEGE